MVIGKVLTVSAGGPVCAVGVGPTSAPGRGGQTSAHTFKGGFP
jgi:hypothetical protein